MHSFIIRYVSLLLAFSFSFLSAQKKSGYEVSATYKVAFKKNKTDKNFQTESYLLLFNKENSVFISDFQYLKDSLSSQSNSESKDIQNKNAKLEGYTVETDIKKSTLSFTQYGNSDELKYGEPSKIEWNLEPDTKEIQGYQVKMATTYLFGRKWIAWYTTEIPYPVGPYKFSGLPGLILEVEDHTDSFHFTVSTISLKEKKISSVLHPNAKVMEKKDFLKIKEKQGGKNDNPLELLP